MDGAQAFYFKWLLRLYYFIWFLDENKICRRLAWKDCWKDWIVKSIGTLFSADLGSSSKYLSENLKDWRR